MSGALFPFLPEHPLHTAANAISMYRWNRSTWRFLHGGTSIYPQGPWANILTCLSYLLPCPKCRLHLMDYLQTVVKSTDQTWFEYTVALHNDVNVRTGATVMDVLVVRERYQQHCTLEQLQDVTWEMLWMLHGTLDVHMYQDPQHLHILVSLLQSGPLELLVEPYAVPTTRDENRSLLVQGLRTVSTNSVALRWWYRRHPTWTASVESIVEDMVGQYGMCLLDNPLPKRTHDLFAGRLASRKRIFEAFTSVQETTQQPRTPPRRTKRTSTTIIVIGCMTVLVLLMLVSIHMFRRRRTVSRTGPTFISRQIVPSSSKGGG